MDTKDARYLLTVAEAIKAGNEAVRPYLTKRCFDCDQWIDTRIPSEHGIAGEYVAIGCEGYYQVNPNTLGQDKPHWTDWRDAVSNPDAYLTATSDCFICDEPNAKPSEADPNICTGCQDEAEEDTRAELTAAGINPDDHPVVIAAEIARRIG